MTWQPIETAPKDGKAFLAFTCDFEGGIPFNPHIQEAYWRGKSPDDYAGFFCSRNGQMVTHWMPLPGPPEFYVSRRSSK